MTSIGIVIGFGCIMGIFLEKSGAAKRMALSILKLVGVKNCDVVLGQTERAFLSVCFFARKNANRCNKMQFLCIYKYRRHFELNFLYRKNKAIFCLETTVQTKNPIAQTKTHIFLFVYAIVISVVRKIFFVCVSRFLKFFVRF